MNTWEIIILCLFGIDLLTEAALHGKPKEGHYNIAVRIIITAIYFFIMYKAGLFH